MGHIDTRTISSRGMEWRGHSLTVVTSQGAKGFEEPKLCRSWLLVMDLLLVFKNCVRCLRHYCSNKIAFFVINDEVCEALDLVQLIFYSTGCLVKDNFFLFFSISIWNWVLVNYIKFWFLCKVYYDLILNPFKGSLCLGQFWKSTTCFS